MSIITDAMVERAEGVYWQHIDAEDVVEGAVRAALEAVVNDIIEACAVEADRRDGNGEQSEYALGMSVASCDIAEAIRALKVL